MKQKTQKSTKTKLIILATSLVIALALIAQIIIDTYVYRNSIQSSDKTVLTNLIIESVNGLHKPAPVDPVSGKVYLTDGRLVLPSPDVFMQVQYANFGDSKDMDLSVTTKSILGVAESKLWIANQSDRFKLQKNNDDIFTEVPSLQACARGVQLFYKPQTGNGSEFQLKATKVLANGHMLYLYTESTCKQDLSPLVDYLKQVQSY